MQRLEAVRGRSGRGLPEAIESVEELVVLEALPAAHVSE
jgi:hypothetical protein